MDFDKDSVQLKEVPLEVPPRYSNANPFQSDAPSTQAFWAFGQKSREKICELESVLVEKSNDAQRHLSDQLTSEELLKSLMIVDEEVGNAEPLQIHLFECRQANDQLLSQQTVIHQAFAQLTSKRLLLMKVERGEFSLLKREKGGCCVREQANVEHKASDGNYFYPIPLKNIHGISLQTSWENTFSQSIQKRPSVILGIVLAACLTAFCLSLPALFTGYFPVTVVLALVALGVSLAFCIISNYKVLLLQYRPIQCRCVKIGFLDPLTQSNLVASLTLDNRYPITAATRFLSLLQSMCPRLANV